jgi:hypothetical protein
LNSVRKAVNVGAVHKTRANSARVAEQQIQCYELRRFGMSIRDIAKETSLSVGTVTNRINAEIARVVLPLADEVRKLELDRLNRWLEKLNAQIEDDDTGARTARNVEVAVKVSERIAKLTGADAPQQVEATVVQVTQEDIALASLVREAQAAAAVAEQQLREGTNP